MKQHHQWALNQAINSLFPYLVLALVLCIFAVTFSEIKPDYSNVLHFLIVLLVASALMLVTRRVNQFNRMYPVTYVQTDSWAAIGLEIGHKDAFGDSLNDSNFNYLRFSNGLVAKTPNNVTHSICEDILKSEWYYFYLVANMKRVYVIPHRPHHQRRTTDHPQLTEGKCPFM